jgi:hypothetical protein
LRGRHAGFGFSLLGGCDLGSRLGLGELGSHLGGVEDKEKLSLADGAAAID